MAWSQNKSPANYMSLDDKELSIQSVYVAPFVDNLNNVYAEKIYNHFKQALSNENQWKVADFSDGAKNQTENLDSSERSRQQLMKKLGVQALITSKIIRGPKGLSLHIYLYTGPQGLLLIQESIDQINTFELEEVKRLHFQLWTQIKRRLPYQAVLLSRRGNQVTLNLGTKNGFPAGQTEVKAILILKLERHPKLNFMVSAEKEILGKIKITKQDDYLSFGEVTYEKESLLLQPGLKIQAEEPPPPPSLADALSDNPAFGKSPKEWLPMKKPQYGKLGFSAGFVQYNQTANLTTIGSIQANNNFAPTVKMSGEFWLNELWFFGLNLKQSALAVSNSYPGSEPSKLNMSLSQQTVFFGYNFLLNNQFFGPKFQAIWGLNQFSSRIDPSTPIAFTTMNYGGMSLGFNGSFPVSEETPLDLGAHYKYYWGPSTSESVGSGAITGTKIQDFGFFGRYHRSQNISYLFDFGFEYYTSTLNPAGAVRADPANEISHKLTNFLVGIEYLF